MTQDWSEVGTPTDFINAILHDLHHTQTVTNAP